MRLHCDVATKYKRDALVAQMKVVYHMAKRDISSNQFCGLTELLECLEAPDFKCGANLYQHNESLNYMEKAIERTLIEDVEDKQGNSSA